MPSPKSIVERMANENKSIIHNIASVWGWKKINILYLKKRCLPVKVYDVLYKLNFKMSLNDIDSI